MRPDSLNSPRYRRILIQRHSAYLPPVSVDDQIGHVKAARAAWREMQKSLDPQRPVFIDETWASTNMTPATGDVKEARCWSPTRLSVMDNLGSYKRADVRKPSKPRVQQCAFCQPTARTSIPSSRSSLSSKTHCAKWHAEPSMLIRIRSSLHDAHAGLRRFGG